MISDSVASQHEAEERTATLAKRNKQLEKELRDVDQMALAVEAEYSSTVKQNSARAQKFQVRIKFFIENIVQQNLDSLRSKGTRLCQTTKIIRLHGLRQFRTYSYICMIFIVGVR